MRINFRQGVVSHQMGGFLSFNGLGNVDILADTRPVTITLAEKTTNYLFSEDVGLTNAWIGPFTGGVDYWLYWEFNTISFARTFGYTNVQPTAQPTAPIAPVTDQVWYNTLTNEQFRWSGSGWIKVLYVFAAKLNSGTFASLSINAPTFTGTQIGSTVSVLAGRPLYSSAGKTIRNDDGTFFTTEDQFFVDTDSSAIRIESNVLRAKCVEPALAEFSIVAYSGPGEIRTAQYEDSQSTICAVLLESLTTNGVGAIVAQGVVTNPAWNFTADVGTPLFVDNGELVSVDPHISNVILNPIPKTPVARVLSTDSIVFEQGLGGVGPRGPRGQVDGIPLATQNDLGAVTLSVSPSNPVAPIAVGDNDPRLVGGPFASLTHGHPATAITFAPSGGLTSFNVQSAILEVNDFAASTAGDTFTGPVILSGAPTSDLHAATKKYVDDSITSARITEQPYDMSFFASGNAASVASTTVGIVLISRAVVIQPGLTNNGFAIAKVPPTTTTVFTFFLNGSTTNATVTFDPTVSGGTVGVVSIPSNITLAAGDIFELVSDSTPEQDIEDVAVTIIGCAAVGTCPA